MADTQNGPYVQPPERRPEPAFSKDELIFTAEEKALIQEFVRQYPSAEGAVMKTLWLAQEKFGWLPPEVIQLVSDELDMPYSQTYGVATFYTQYYKKKMGKHVIDVCTCFSCQVCGGYDMLHYIEDKLGIKDGETTPDGMFTVKGVECLGSCGTAPMAQIGKFYYENLTEEKINKIIEVFGNPDSDPFIKYEI